MFHVTNPEGFHRAFQTSSEFIQKFEQLLGDRDQIGQLRSSPAYKDYSKKWQLSVYFQLCHNEICSNVEQRISNEPVVNVKNQLGLCLEGAIALYDGISTLWGDKIFIKQLGHRFWKSTLLVTSDLIS